MKEHEQRIAIAEACGWTCCGQVTGCVPHGYPPDVCKPTTKELIDGTGPSPWDVPDYLNDLNAMHEAFKNLGRHWEIRQIHDGYLCNIQFGPRNKDITVAGLELLEVMSEAFLRTIGKWKEDA